MNDLETTKAGPRWTGRHVVLGMLLFGVTMVAALWLYWELYTRPFRALQNAINIEFPDSSPRAIGGKEKSHRSDNSATLRIIVRVAFDPNAEPTRAAGMAERLAIIAGEHHDLSQYDKLEIHLTQRVPEAETRHWSVSRPVSEWPSGPSASDEHANVTEEAL